jgi:hypothetical protein
MFLSVDFNILYLFSVLNVLIIIFGGEFLFWSCLLDIVQVSCTCMGIIPQSHMQQ